MVYLCEWRLLHSFSLCELIVHHQHFNPFFTELNATPFSTLNLFPLCQSEMNKNPGASKLNLPAPGRTRAKVKSIFKRGQIDPSPPPRTSFQLQSEFIFINRPDSNSPSNAYRRESLSNISRLYVRRAPLHTRHNINSGLNNHNTFEISISARARKKLGGI